MNTEIQEVEINGVKYVRKDSVVATAALNSKNAVIIRSETAGAFFGYVLEKNEAAGVVKLAQARRLWYWDGAASLSQLAMEGTSKPQSCKFPVAVTELTVCKVIEIIPVTENSIASINGVKVWKA